MWILIPIGVVGAVFGWQKWKKGKEQKQLAIRVVQLGVKYAAKKASDLERVELHDAANAIGLPAIALAVKAKKRLPEESVIRLRQMAA